MAALTCDICGGSLSMDPSGEFAVCDSCGMKHTKERMHSKVQEITGTVKISNLPTIESLMKRGHFDQVLDIDPEYAPAYVGKLCENVNRSPNIRLRENDLFIRDVKKQADLARFYKPLDDMSDYQKAIRFADETLRAQLEGYNNEIKKRIAELKNKYSFFMIIGYAQNINAKPGYWDNRVTFEIEGVYIGGDNHSLYVGYLRDGMVFKILRTGKQYRYKDKAIYCAGESDSINYGDIHEGDIAVITIEDERKEQERLAEQEKRAREEQERQRIEEERKAREERERQVEALYQKGKAAYEEGKKSIFSRKKKYQEAADFFRRAAEQGHAGAREYLDRLKTEGK
ncbi:hypothetical protein AGMMS49546_14020 [Spirochaetia bacterium]|nr:hypothetical protein AGMMS49546_14020 [Spirochaetia bacterium]